MAKGRTATMYQKSVLSNGIRLVTEELPHSQAVSLGLWLKVGSRDEAAAENGLTHFLEHMVFKGTPRRTVLDIAREIDQLGGSATPSPPGKTPASTGKVLEGQLARAVDLIVDLAIQPGVPARGYGAGAHGHPGGNCRPGGQPRRPGAGAFRPGSSGGTAPWGVPSWGRRRHRPVFPGGPPGLPPGRLPARDLWWWPRRATSGTRPSWTSWPRLWPSSKTACRPGSGSP